ncbi:alpha-1,2-fucosyltransferase [Burkholderia vietnamiensis]|uniref:Alpha-1,2-fucosyltransferase n=1 Tax=Burkholderia vietnamiensis TaxID=60552 RepID=A0AAW7T6B0_BURVI|nr:alpha-1,2-fucosyltransferase [Burkholderia vietnamiensis]MDN7797717.1 alpha-1,2-fucosyltransferase [Burkholderia vietnamiensis]HDR8999698.1 alpha-1,2-fucosyltransferase [Burkholderia vietnamiensis]HDR9074232.1 alpha-1,2-fucosyltransferase [Burkholderia vietnamiensis]HDR9204245.1 alpha-1,2-fucosyltransferase [Burkholderia vietnamiensis]
MKYCYPELGGKDLLFARVAGPGLGNMLFPWARALVASHKSGYKLIEPTWPQIKIGPWIRGERDSRSYGNLFNRSHESLTGIARLKALTLQKRVSEEKISSARDGDVVTFSGMHGYFRPIIDDHQLVASRLRAISRKEHRAGLEWDFSSSICMHVRLGDFAAAAPSEVIASGKTNVRLPLQWYREVAEGIRAIRGRDTRIYLFSDGSDHELEPLLRLDNCRRMSFGSALADLLALTQSECLIASGSTFSMWASYLGRMPVFWCKGQRRHQLYQREHMEPEVETRIQAIEAAKEIFAAR